jgi:plasmid stabilization system protein ParE
VSAIDYAPRALADIERLIDFLLSETPAASAAGTSAQAAGEAVINAVEILADHPLIGRPAEAGLRELTISRGRSGYVALYRFDVARDRVVVLAIRHQREAGYG